MLMQAPAASVSGSVFERADVRLTNVTKMFGSYVAVDNISLIIESGQFFSLLGPSGCGKSTTLAMIGGFDEPDQGTITLGGVDVSHQPPYRRDVNTVFQSYALFPHLSVFENVAFGLRRKRLAAAEIKTRVGEMLSLVDLAGYETRWPGKLSGGQQQRVALARALVNRPKLLLLDEPLGALDNKLRKQMQLELKRIQTEIGITFLFVTHDQEEAMVMSDQLAVMSGGKIEQVGTPADVYDNPATEFVASFLGVSNLMEGEVVEHGTALRLAGGETIQLPSGRMASGNTRIKAGVRPEKIIVLPPGAPADPAWNIREGTIELATYLGVNHQYVVRAAGGQSISVYAQNSGMQSGLAAGDAVRLAWHRDHTFMIET